MQVVHQARLTGTEAKVVAKVHNTPCNFAICAHLTLTYEVFLLTFQQFWFEEDPLLYLTGSGADMGQSKELEAP